jgi:hypothetical protein
MADRGYCTTAADSTHEVTPQACAMGGTFVMTQEVERDPAYAGA